MRRAALPGLIVALAMLTACASEKPSPTPTLIALRSPFPTTTRIPTIIPLPTPTVVVTYTVTPTIEPPPTRTPSITPTVSNTPLPTLRSSVGTPVAAIGCRGAVGSNLLVNSGFEGGQHPQDEVVEVQAPDGWAAYWRTPGTPTDYDPANPDGYQRPEMAVIAREPAYIDPPRVLEGRQAFHIEGNQRAFDAGIYQQVAVAPGDVLCLIGSAQAWSNRYSDDPFTSTFDSGDDQRNANFQLGIDPAGGTDPFSPSVRWGDVQHIYDAYKPMNQVRLQATGATITAFVRGAMLWRFSHNEMFFDAMSLVKVSP